MAKLAARNTAVAAERARLEQIRLHPDGGAEYEAGPPGRGYEMSNPLDVGRHASNQVHLSRLSSGAPAKFVDRASDVLQRSNARRFNSQYAFVTFSSLRLTTIVRQVLHDAVRHPELKLKIPAPVFCMSWRADFEFRGGHRTMRTSEATPRRWWSPSRRRRPRCSGRTSPSISTPGSPGRSARWGWCSRRRDSHSAAPPSTFSRCFNIDGEGMSVN